MPISVVESFARRLGQVDHFSLGSLSEQSIRRYALACGETDPRYLDRSVARQQGFSDLPALPNYLAAMSDSDHGAAEDELNVDGTPVHGRFGRLPPGIAVLGGSEELEFHGPVVANTVVHRSMTLSNVESRQSRQGGLLCLVTFEDEFATDGDELLLRVRRTAVLK